FVGAGRVLRIADGIAMVSGLFDVRAGEMVTFVASGFKGMALNLNTFTVGVVIFGIERYVRQGDVVVRTGQLLSVSVGENLLGRVIDPLGNLLDQSDSTNTSAES